MADVVQEMLQQALGHAARSSKFEAFLNFSTPALGPESREVYLHVKTSAFPGKSHEPVDFRFKGRSIPIRGQTKYDNTWECTFYLTEGHEVKLAFENWIESLDQTENMDSDLPGPVKAGQSMDTQYMSECMIAQMDFAGEEQTAVYTLHNVFPKRVSVVQNDYSAVGTVLEYTVEFSFSHYTAVTLKTQKDSAKSGGGPGNLGKSEIASPGSGNFAGFGKDAGQMITGAVNGAVNGALKGALTNLGNAVANPMLSAVNDAFGKAKDKLAGKAKKAVSSVTSSIKSLSSVFK